MAAKPSRIAREESILNGGPAAGRGGYAHGCSRYAACRERCQSAGSNMKDLGVARLDLIALGLDRDRIVFHQLDVAQRLAAGLLLDRGMRRAQAPEVRHELLRLRGEHVALEQARRIGVRRVLEHAVRADDER